MLDPTDYLIRLRDLMKATEPELWAFFASAPRVGELVEEMRAQLLRSTYRLEPGTHPVAYAAAEKAAAALGIDDPVHLYQAQFEMQSNASCVSMPGEAHVVFSGTVLDLLDPPELTALLGHELGHHLLWSLDGGDFWVLDRLVHSSADDLGATTAHDETARLTRLNTELFCDRGAYLAAGDDLAVAVASLVKVTTGLQTVSGEAYVRQAGEVLGDDAGQKALSHPETFFRAWALATWAEHGADGEETVSDRLLGDLELERLDLVGQHRLTELSARLVRQFLEPRWTRSDVLVGYAKTYGAAAVPSRKTAAPVARDELDGLGASVRDYLAYLLLDLATADQDLADATLAQALEISSALGLCKDLDGAARKELGLTVAALRSRRSEAAAVLETAQAS